MMTRRQKKSVHAFTAVLSSCALLAGFLIFTNISNTRATEPVVFSEILEGAVDYSAGEPKITLPDSELTETMFSDEMETFTMTLPPGYTSYSEPAPGSSSSAGKVTYETPDEVTAQQPDNEGPEIIEESDESTQMLLSNEPAANGPETTSSSSETTTTAASSADDNATYVTTAAATSVSAATKGSTTAASSVSRTTVTTTKASTTTKVSTTTASSASRTAAATTKASSATTTAGTAADDHETEKPPFTNIGGGTFSTDTNVYLTMFRLVNDARKEAGLNELWYSARIHEICELRTTELTSYYSHTRPDGTKFSTAFTEKGFNYQMCGENIAYGKNMFKTPEEVFKAWMDSPSHRENILNPKFECAAFGLSILKVGKDTYYYWSQEFAKLP